MMQFSFSDATRNRAKRVHPHLWGVCEAAILDSGVDFGCTEEQSRTIAEQQKKIDDGFSKLKDPRRSKHVIQAGSTTSNAVDLVWYDAERLVDVGGKKVVKPGYSWASFDPYFEIAAAMQRAAIKKGVRVKWGAIWDKCLNDLPLGAAALRKELDRYKARHAGPDFLDGPHFELC